MENTVIQTESTSENVSQRWLTLHLSRRTFALALGLAALYLCVAMISHFFTGPSDHSLVDELRFNGWSVDLPPAANWSGSIGAWISHYMIFEWLGVSAFLVPIAMALSALHLCKKISFDPRLLLLPVLSVCLYLDMVLGFFALNENSVLLHTLSGGVGHELAYLLHKYLGVFTPLALVLVPLGIGVYYLGSSISPWSLKKPPKEVDTAEETPPADTSTQADNKNLKEQPFPDFELEFTAEAPENPTEDTPSAEPTATTETIPDQFNFEVEKLQPEQPTEPAAASQYPTEPPAAPQPPEDSDSYKLPPLSLLPAHKEEKIQVDMQEIEQNKEKIVETLTNFSISISTIKAAVGPTFTLYEIIPGPGIRISKIKNLEDDIALSLSALGIRIIAPMPGKGTIGIEVPNKNREITPLRTALAHPNFQSSTYEMPIVLGKNISGDVKVVDLCSMPHILMAGATGQGKSVGLNVMLSSLLYKKRPKELKLVLIDPKKVELSLFSCIEQHFLAKVPNSAEAIITDMQQVIHTLNALCQEMDNRYELLKNARCRNIKEYNSSLAQRGAELLPYIVLVIDELADLMMTAGKEVETPIARLAQLARAIGIHLIVATQRPSVNVITGIIKANFPARISYRVTSQIDSRTILDSRGAEQLVGMGDMLFSTGNEHIRLQCPYIETKEVESICEFISAQATSVPSYLLPEIETESNTREQFDSKARDLLFEDAATLIVQYQQGSASFLQRKMEIGFNRAGRLMDQLEDVDIVGPSQGSKPREVLLKDLQTLSQLLDRLRDFN